MTIGIYKLEFAGTSMCYIGQSLNIQTRFKQHLNLMRKQESSIKLNKAYLDYGNPTLEILAECNQSELDTFEKETIEIFDSVNKGFNVNLSAGGKSSITGQEHHNSLYTNSQIYQVLRILINNTEFNFKEISNITKVSKNVIAGIACLQQHKWLQTEYGSEYSKLSKQHLSGLRSKTTKRGIKLQEYILISPELALYTVTNTREFAKMHGLDHSHLNKVQAGLRKSHKGWKLHQA